MQALLYKVIYRHVGRVITGPEYVKRNSVQLMPPTWLWAILDTLAAAEWNHMASPLCLLIPHSLESPFGFCQTLLFCDPMTPHHVGGGQRWEADLLWLFFRAESKAVSGSPPFHPFRLPSLTPSPINWTGVPYCLAYIFTSVSEIKKLVKTPKICMYVCKCVHFFSHCSVESSGKSLDLELGFEYWFHTLLAGTTSELKNTPPPTKKTPKIQKSKPVSGSSTTTSVEL